MMTMKEMQRWIIVMRLASCQIKRKEGGRGGCFFFLGKQKKLVPILKKKKKKKKIKKKSENISLTFSLLINHTGTR